MTPRIEAELALLRARYPALQTSDRPNGVQVTIPEFPLPPGWCRTNTDLAFVIPVGYPATPPDNFFVRPPLTTAAGGPPGNYQADGTGLGLPGWGGFSFHLRDEAETPSWSPAADPTTGDNLLSFLRAVNDRLLEAN